MIISLAFVTQSYCVVPRNIMLNSNDYFVMKTQKKKRLRQTAFNHSSDIDFLDFMTLYKKCTEKPYTFLVIDKTLASDNTLRFRDNFIEII